jgi:hypothetical protein
VKYPTFGLITMGFITKVILGLFIVFTLVSCKLWRKPNMLKRIQNFDKPRTLLVLYGQPRGGRYAWVSIRKHVLVPLNAHLATFFTDDCPRTILYDMATYRWNTHAHQNWGVILDDVAKRCGNHPNWKVLCKIHNQALGGITECDHIGSGGIMLAFRWLVQQKILELGLDKKYDYMILSRADQLHICNHKPMSMLHDNSVVVPYGEEYTGWPDRHIVAKTPSFIQAVNITNELVCNADAWSISLNQTLVNPEYIQKVVWDKYNLDVVQTERTMFTVRAQGDPTRWSEGDENVLTKPLNLKVKYSEELRLVLSQCSSEREFVEELQRIKLYTTK